MMAIKGMHVFQPYGEGNIQMKMTGMIAAMCGAILVAGCSTVETDSAEVSTSPERKKITVKVDPDRSVQITNVTVSHENDILRVSGTLRPKSTTSRMAGHIHVSFLDIEGSTIRHLKAEPNVKAFFRRSIIKPRFSVSTALVDAEVSEVRLKHHDASMEICSYGVGSPSSMGDLVK